jgi:hypothetical protein
MEVMGESWAPGQKNPPVFITNRRYILVDER